MLRLKVLQHYLFKKNNVSFLNIISFLFSIPHQFKVGKYIEKVDLSNKLYTKIWFYNINTPLFFPIKYKINLLYQTILETFQKNNWHYYELPETRVCDNDVVVDCGAAEGLFSLSCFNRAKHVYLIEPLDVFVNSLKQTFLDIKNITIIEKAISSKSFFTNIVDNGLASSLSESNKKSENKIEVSTLDKLFYDKGIPITYIKIDLEGYDFLALLGAERLIKKNKPKIAVTTYHDVNHLLEIKEFLSKIVPEYNFIHKGIFSDTGAPVMLHAWI